ncbi:aconitate hydratase AcnA [Stomatohabitans albus]|uniref:aconitate hydratase AcnA n=1 Tax=Stomatohabitans albus TaxID=3110766 RepID=UPI003AB97BBA
MGVSTTEEAPVHQDFSSTLTVGSRRVRYTDITKLGVDLNRLPYAIRILLENVARNRDGENVTDAHIQALAHYDGTKVGEQEILFTPARVLLQDFTGVPAVVDLAVMRDALAALGGDPQRINPLVPVDLVIDHSIQVDKYAVADAFKLNAQIEFRRNTERYEFLRWGQTAFNNFSVVPPNTGIVHQVNLEFLGQVVFDATDQIYPDTLVGTDSHTPMINGLGVVGWGVGGIEAEAAMLGQPISMLIPEVIGVELTGELPDGATATDLVLTVTELLRQRGVVGKFVEFFGESVANVPVSNRATIGNMSPEFGSTISIFPIDEKTLDYLHLTGRDEAHIAMVEAYAKANGLWHDPAARPAYTDTLTLDLSTVVPSISGPKLPQQRIPLDEAKQTIRRVRADYEAQDDSSVPVSLNGSGSVDLGHGDVVIAAITSCTNTSNPSVMMAAGLVARKAHALGLTRKPWVKTSLAPGSKVVTDYYQKAGLLDDLSAIGFDVVGYGCTTCIGNSGPLEDTISQAINEHDLAVAAVLSGNRNFEGRISPDTKMNFLMSPPLVVAYALAGTTDIDLTRDPIGQDHEGNDVFLADVWPTNDEIEAVINTSLGRQQFIDTYNDVFTGDEAWQGITVSGGDRFAWSDESTYIAKPTFFDDMPAQPAPLADIMGARVLVKVGDSVTTDHISPAGAIAQDSPAGQWLTAHGVERKDFNSYGSRRGNHEVMMRGTFANIRLRNELAPGTEGGFTIHLPSGEQTTIFEASERYRAAHTPLLVIAGEQYGSGSSRDWAAKGPNLLGVRAVIAKSYERIHRSNLIGMGILPMQFKAGDDLDTFGLDGTEVFDFTGIANQDQVPSELSVRATQADGTVVTFVVDVRIDTPNEQTYYRNGGILHTVLRQLAAS